MEITVEKPLEKMNYMELRQVAKNNGIKQKQIIKLMAERLLALKRFTKMQIRDKIVEDLEDVGVTQEYVNRILGPEYSDQRKNSYIAKKDLRERAKLSNPSTGESIRSDKQIKMTIPDELMDLIDDSRGDTPVVDFIIRVLREYYVVVTPTTTTD